MIVDIQDLDQIAFPADTLLAATVALTFFFMGLLTVYHRNEEYQSRKLQQKEKRQHSAQKVIIESTCDLREGNGKGVAMMMRTVGAHLRKRETKKSVDESQDYH